MSLGVLRNGENDLQVFHHVKRERERERECSVIMHAF